MIWRIAALFILLFSSIAFADAPTGARACKEITEPLVRLKCYDNAAATDEITAQKVFVEIVESPAALAAIAAALLALISGISGPIVQLKIGKRQAAAAQTSA
jgi:hypothetical protein